MEQKILSSPLESSVFQFESEKETDLNDSYSNYNNEINEERVEIEKHKSRFLSIIEENSKSELQAGYSKTKKCDFILLVLVSKYYGDGEFQGWGIQHTYLINEDKEIVDVNNNQSEYGECTIDIVAAYHPLADGRVLEFNFSGPYYQEELNNIYDIVKKTRLHCLLEEKLSEDSNKNKNRLKI